MLKQSLIKNKKTSAVEDAIQIVTFQVGAEEYGMDIQTITEVIRPLKITPLPRMPEFIEGVINLRGTIIPIVDLRKRFSLEVAGRNAKRARIIIVQGAVLGVAGDGGELIGLVVDAVREVQQLPRKDIEPAPSSAVGRDVGFISGMGKVGERLIVLLDITKILSQQERSALAEAGRDANDKSGPRENVKAGGAPPAGVGGSS